MTSPWILLDASHFAHKARFALKDLSVEDHPTGVLFGFFEQILTVANHPQIQSNRFLIFMDSKTSYRKKSFPPYKERRSIGRTEEEWKEIMSMHKQMDILRKEVLPQIGFPIYGQKGLESDDLIAFVAKEFTRKKEKTIIISSDADLYQCLTEYVTMYNPVQNFFYTPSALKRKKGVTPEQWGFVKAVGGCNTDCVPGLTGVGEKGAIDYLLGKTPAHYKRYKIIQEAIESGEIKKWSKLVVLPHRRTKKVKVREPQYQKDVFFEFCQKFEIESYLNGAGKKQWLRFFDGKFSDTPRKREKDVK